MTWKTPVSALAAVLLLTAAFPAWADFNASDLILVPVVVHGEGVDSSVWRSDLFITNVEADVNVDVMLVYAPSGLRDNSYLFYSSNPRQYWLGGREEEGFGFVDETLADILPNETVVLEDLVGEYFSDSLGTGGAGALIVFAYEAGTLDAETGRVQRNIVVNSRTYNETTVWSPDPDNEGEYLEEAATYGQNMPGVAWYNLADAGAVSEETGDFSYEILLGGAENEDYRFNVGVFNSSDIQTSLLVRIKPYQADGQPYLDEDTGNELSVVTTLPPLCHLQYNAVLALSFSLEDVENIRIEVGIAGFTTTSVNPVPMLKSYGSLVDNVSNDPTTILPTFEAPYNVECMWPSEVDDGSGGQPKTTVGESGLQGSAANRRPFDVPPRWVD